MIYIFGSIWANYFFQSNSDIWSFTKLQLKHHWYRELGQNPTAIGEKCWIE